MKVTEITELIDRVQEQLDNNWAVSKEDITDMLAIVRDNKLTEDWRGENDGAV